MYIVQYIGPNDQYWRYRCFYNLEGAENFINENKKEGIICHIYRKVEEE